MNDIVIELSNDITISVQYNDKWRLKTYKELLLELHSLLEEKIEE